MNILIAAILSIVSASVQDNEDKNEYRPHFTWNFRYPNVMSRENLTEESWLINDLVTRSMDSGLRQIGTEEEKAFTRQKMSMLALFSLLPLAASLFKGGHEMGHLQAWSKSGFSSRHFLYYDQNNHPHRAPNLPTMTGRVMAGSGLGFSQASSDADQSAIDALNNDPRLAAHYTEFNAAFYAGGLNQDQYASEQMADRIRNGQAIILDLPLWLFTFISTMRYESTGTVGDDIDIYVDASKTLGVRTNEGHVRNLQWMRFANGSSVAMIYGLWRFLKHCDRQINPLPIPFPEFASYLSTESGPTFKVRLPVQLDRYWDIPLLIEPSYQTPIDRSGHNEFGLRARYQITDEIDASAGGFTNTSGGTWLESRITARPWRWLEINLGFDRGRGYTFNRDIEGMTLPFLVKNEWSLKLGVGLIFRF